jgi:hypothetical protein
MCADQTANRKQKNLIQQKDVAEQIINGELTVQNIVSSNNNNLFEDDNPSDYINNFIRSDSEHQLNSLPADDTF